MSLPICAILIVIIFSIDLILNLEFRARLFKHWKMFEIREDRILEREVAEFQRVQEDLNHLQWVNGIAKQIEPNDEILAEYLRAWIDNNKSKIRQMEYSRIMDKKFEAILKKRKQTEGV